MWPSHLAVARCRWPSLPCCRRPLHMLSTTFPVCASSASPPCARSIYIPFPQVDSRACDGKAVTSSSSSSSRRATSWPAETAPGYHHHPPTLPSSDCELAESLLNSDPSPPHLEIPPNNTVTAGDGLRSDLLLRPLT